MTTTPRWLARSGAALAVAIVVGATAMPAQADPPHIEFGAATDDSITVGAEGSSGTGLYLEVIGYNAIKPVITFDTSGLSKIATTRFPQDCKVTDTKATCAFPTAAELNELLTVVIHGTAKAGATGSLKYTADAENTEPMTRTVAVTLGDGVDLVFTGGSPVANAKPGDKVGVPVSFFNSGTRTAKGIRVTFDVDISLVPGQFENCTYLGKHGVVCDYPTEVAPGSSAKLVGGSFPFTLANHAFGTQAAYVTVEALDEASPVIAKAMTKGVKGSGGKRSTLETSKAVRAAAPTDLNERDNWGVSFWEVANTYDVEALGSTASGSVGAEVKVNVGGRNNGPALLGNRSGDSAFYVTFDVPAGTKVVKVPAGCFGEKPGGSDSSSEPGLPRYVCWSKIYMAPGDTLSAAFTLKIVEVKPNVSGVVKVNRALDDPEGGPADTKPANNVAAVVINPPAGAGGTGGGLPITGENTGLVAGGGIALLVAGAAIFFVARRRRVVLVTPDN